MKKIISLLLVALTLFSLSINVFATKNTAADYAPLVESQEVKDKKEIKGDLLAGLEINEEMLAKSEDLVVRQCGSFLLDEANKMKSKNVDELNSYINTVKTCISSGSFSQLDSLNSYVETFIAEAKANNPSMLNELNFYIEDAISNMDADISSKNSLLSAEVLRNADSQNGIWFWINIWLGAKLAWLAAAQIARYFGYTCSAKLVEYSVYGINYYETNGLFRNKIINTSVYKTLISQLTLGKKSYNITYSGEFTKGISKDLYYSLHYFNIIFKKPYGQPVANITDRYDFKLDYKYDNIFTSCVNNWAWLCSQVYVLFPIYVSIVIK